MVNPDGVIHGNSRCNLAGFDLNRKWGLNELKVIMFLCLVINSLDILFKKIYF